QGFFWSTRPWMVPKVNPTSAVRGLKDDNSSCFPPLDPKSWHYILLRLMHARRQPQTLRQLQTQVTQQDRLSLIRADHTAQANRSPVGRRSDHIGALDAGQLLQHGRRAIPQPRPRHPSLQRLAQDIRQEADQQVRLHATRGLMPDWADAEIRFLRA